MERTKIGIVGCGTIGLEIAKAIQSRLKDKAELVAVCDIDKAQIDKFLSKLNRKPPVCCLEELIKKCDFVLEAASAKVSSEIARRALSAKKNVLIMSVGGLLAGNKDLFDLARKNNSRLYIPSGALAGLDGLKSASVAGIKKVTLTTKKAPKALEGAPYLLQNQIDLSSIKEEKVIFEGTALEAVRGFPKNVNVAATLSLASLGPQKTRVRIVAVPGLKQNMHEIEAEGEFGKFFARTENNPSPDNPKTSYLAALSAIATLEGALDNVRIGT